MWGTLDDLKGKLGIPSADTSRDSALNLVLEGATAKVAEMARYSEADITGQRDIFEQVQLGTLLVLKKRPVAEITAVEGRWYMSQPDWSEMMFDLSDPTEGYVTPLGRDAWWPPLLVLRPKFEEWRNYIWPFVRVTYDVTGQGTGSAAPDELQDTALALAAYWYDRELAGAGSDIQLGQLSKEMMDAPVPSWVLSKLTKHRKERATWV